MAGGMIGANPEELRALAGIFGAKAETARTGRTTTETEVDGVEWLGPDADAFRDRYRGEVAPTLGDLAAKLDEARAELERQAQEQDDCSKGRPLGGPTNSPTNGPANPGDDKNWWEQLRTSPFGQFWTNYRNIAKGLRGYRSIMDFTAALSVGLPWRPSWTNHLFAESVASEFAPLNRLYQGSKMLGDFAQGNWKDLPLISKWSPSGLLEAKLGNPSWINTFAGKEGRLLGKGFGLFDVGFNAGDMINNYRNGDIGAGNYSLAKTAIAGLQFVPGPVGLGATVVSLGLAAYDTNFLGFRDTANSVGTAIKDTAKKLWPF